MSRAVYDDKIGKAANPTLEASKRPQTVGEFFDDVAWGDTYFNFSIDAGTSFSLGPVSFGSYSEYAFGSLKASGIYVSPMVQYGSDGSISLGASVNVGPLASVALSTNISSDMPNTSIRAQLGQFRVTAKAKMDRGFLRLHDYCERYVRWRLQLGR